MIVSQAVKLFGFSPHYLPPLISVIDSPSLDTSPLIASQHFFFALFTPFLKSRRILSFTRIWQNGTLFKDHMNILPIKWALWNHMCVLFVHSRTVQREPFFSLRHNWQFDHISQKSRVSMHCSIFFSCQVTDTEKDGGSIYIKPRMSEWEKWSKSLSKKHLRL